MRVRTVAGWLPALLLVPAAVVGGIAVSVPEDDLAAMREQQPLDLGTTWVYEVFDHGEPSGTRTSQVSGRAELIASGAFTPTVEQDRHYTDYPGTGPRSFTAYVAVEGNTVYQYAQEEAGTWYAVEPKIQAYRVPSEAGTTWSYEGLVGTIDYSAETELTEIVDVEVGGKELTGCAHFVNTIKLDVEDDPDAVEVVEEWTCPGIGTVRIRDVAEATGADITEELVEFHGVEQDWYAEGHGPEPVDLPEPTEGSHDGFGPTRTFAVPDGRLGREPVWTDLRPERAILPPTSDGEVMVLAEPDGVVSVRTVDTGEMLWKVQLRGPILASPVVVGDLVVVSDSRRQVWALDRDTGRARWSHTLPDLVSAAPVVAGDRVLVPSDDGTLVMLDATDGSVAWESVLADAVRTAPAYDGEHVLVSDAAGTLSALDPASGDVDWAVTFDEGLVQGPLVTDGSVLVEDTTGIVHAFAPDGSVAWQTRGRGNGTAPMVAGNGVVVTSNNVDTLTAFDTTDGSRLWRRTVDTVRSAPAVVGDELVLVTRRGRVEVLGLHDGDRRDSWPLEPAADDAGWFIDVDFALVGDALVLSAWGGGDLMDTALFAYPVGPDPASPAPRLVLTSRDAPGQPTEPPLLVGDDALVATTDGLFTVGPDGSATQLFDSGDAIQTMGTVAGGLAIAPHGETVQARSLADGSLVWESPGGAAAFGAVPAASDDTVVYPLGDQGLVGVDLEDGEPRWVAPVPDQRVAVSPVALPDGDVLYGGGGLARYDGDTGEELWRDATAHLLGSPAYAGGSVYASSLDPETGAARLAAYDARTGAERWSQPVTDTPLYLSPAVGDGVVVAFDGSTARAHDAASGAELWTVPMAHAAAGSPVVSDGLVFLAEGGHGEDIDDDGYRVSVHDVRTGRFLGAWEPDATPFTATPAVGPAADRQVFVPTSTTLALLEAR